MKTDDTKIGSKGKKYFWNEKNIHIAEQILNGKKPIEIARVEGVSSSRISAVALGILRLAARRAKLEICIDSISEAKAHKGILIKALNSDK